MREKTKKLSSILLCLAWIIHGVAVKVAESYIVTVF